MAITAAVVGVILNLSLWFGLHVLFGEVEARGLYGLRLLVPNIATVDLLAVLLFVFALVAMRVFKLNMVAALAATAALGAASELLF